MGDQRVALGAGPDDVVTVSVDVAKGRNLQVIVCRAAADGVPYLIIDTDDHTSVRIDVNDGRLALVDDGGARITLPAHWREYDIDESE